MHRKETHSLLSWTNVRAALSHYLQTNPLEILQRNGIQSSAALKQFDKIKCPFKEHSISLLVLLCMMYLGFASAKTKLGHIFLREMRASLAPTALEKEKENV